MTDSTQHSAWSLLFKPLQWIALMLVFFLVVTPLALIMRLAGRDAMHLKLKAMGESCRVASDKRSADHLNKTY